MGVARVPNETIESGLLWRYATKRFDAGKKISPRDWQTLEQALVLAPSSFGLQPWRFVVVQDAAVRKQIRAVAWDQSQVEDASHLVIFAAKRDMGQAEIDQWVARIAEVRGLPKESLAQYRSMMMGFLCPPREGLSVLEWTKHQTYLAVGSFLSVAAMMGIDACPMEGFDPAKVDEILALNKAGYASAVMVAAGYRSSADSYAALKKVRFAKDEVVKAG